MATLLSATLTTAIAATATTPLVGLGSMKYVAMQSVFVYGSGGTDVNCYLQTSLDGGTTWIDIMNHKFLTTTASKVSAVVWTTALAAGATPADGALAANTILSGLIGNTLRLKYVTTGTYAAATTIKVDIIIKGDVDK